VGSAGDPAPARAGRSSRCSPELARHRCAPVFIRAPRTVQREKGHLNRPIHRICRDVRVLVAAAAGSSGRIWSPLVDAGAVVTASTISSPATCRRSTAVRDDVTFVPQICAITPPASS